LIEIGHPNSYRLGQQGEIYRGYIEFSS